MPKFTLDSINYVITDSRQKILNIDFTNENNEKKSNVSFFTDNESGTYTNRSQIDFGIVDGISNNEHGFVFLSNPNLVIRSLYDVKDVALKSAVAERITNRNEINKERNEKNDNIDMYIPHLKEDPIGFVQNKRYSYGISKNTVIGPVLQSTNLYEQKHWNILSDDNFADSYGNPTWRFFLNPYDKYDSNDTDPSTVKNVLPAYFYTPLSELSNVVFNTLSTEYASMLNIPDLSASTLSDIMSMSVANTSSYYSFMAFFGQLSSGAMSNLFKPVHNFENLNHNYIFEVPLREGNTENNQYNLGIVNTDMIMAKNIFDDIYDSRTSSVGEFNHIRSYKNISTVGRKVFLTYFDDLEYSPKEKAISKNLTYEDCEVNGPEDVTEEPNQNNEHIKRDYVKIECIDAINRFVSTSLHKANLYSVKVHGLENNLLSDPKYDSPNNEYRENIKQDIRNSIKRIVSNFAPAHTQYFDVVEFSRETPKTADKEWC